MKQILRRALFSTSAMMLTSGTASADVFPKREILAVTSDFVGGSVAEELRFFLSEEGFTIFEKHDESWRTLDDEWGVEHPAISRRLNELGCIDARCRFFWATERRETTIFGSLYAHSYNFGWIERNGFIFEIIDDHLLWIGNK